MSARKLSDKEFDLHIKNILQKPEGVLFDEKAWAAIEGKVANLNNTGSNLNQTKWVLLLLSVILSIGGYFSYEYLAFNVSEKSTERYEQVDDGTPYGSSTRAPDSTLLSASEQFNYSNATEANKSPETGTGEQTNQPAGPIQGTIEASQPSLSITEHKRESGIVENVRSPYNSSINQGKKFPSTENSGDGVLLGPTDGGEQREVLLFDSLSSKEIEWFAGSNQNEENLHLVLITIDSNEYKTMEEDEEEPIIRNPPSRWNIGLVLAPDFSTVRQFREFTQPGMDVGFTVEYFLFNKLSIATGAILTRKIYNTTRITEYTIPRGFWTEGVTPNKILADCKVVDIPVNLKYRLVQGKRTAIFVSAGLSSYLMLNEAYDYKYDSESFTGSQVEELEISNENNYFFGVYNLSAGVTYRLKSNISLEAEPYLKNSIDGVGWGQVRLKSTGVLFSLRYHFRKN